MDNIDFIQQAKEEFKKYVKDGKEKMTYEDFERFIKDFFNDKPESLRNINIKSLFEDFSKEEKGKLDEREFRVAYEELKISRMDTSDRIKFEQLLNKINK